MSLTVLDPGLATRVVDLGRPATRHLGVPFGGAADRACLALANAMVGNTAGAAALEIALKGPIVRADLDVTVAVVGAPFTLTSGSQQWLSNRSLTVRGGTELYVGGTPAGARAYLAVPGGFEVPNVLGSRSGLRNLRAGEKLALTAGLLPSRRLHPDCPFLDFPREWRLRFLPGAQSEWFPPGEFEGRTFQVSAASNRMGLRLTSEPLTVPRRELVSEPVCPGSVQVTREGQAIVLGVDGQTIGGYPKVAHVIRADLDALGQMRPGDRVRFEPVDLAHAAALFGERQRALGEWLTRIRISLDGP